MAINSPRATISAPQPRAQAKAAPQIVLFNRERSHVDDARGNGFWRGCLFATVCWIAAWFGLSEVRNDEVAKVLERGAIMARAMERADAVSVSDAAQDALKQEK